MKWSGGEPGGGGGAVGVERKMNQRELKVPTCRARRKEARRVRRTLGVKRREKGRRRVKRGRGRVIGGLGEVWSLDEAKEGISRLVEASREETRA